jgi:hypothetical protein
MKTYQITVEDKDSELLFQILKNLKIVKHFQSEDLVEFQQDWIALATESLNNAYADNEPDYEQVPLKQVNPNYQNE